MTRALLIVSYQQLRPFCAKDCLLLCLHSPLLFQAGFRTLLIIHYCIIEKIAGRHQLITPPLPPRLSANEVSKAFACIVPSSRTPLLQAAFIRVDLHLLAARPAISPDKSQTTNTTH
jgi:hypothetical protein